MLSWALTALKIISQKYQIISTFSILRYFLPQFTERTKYGRKYIIMSTNSHRTFCFNQHFVKDTDIKKNWDSIEILNSIEKKSKQIFLYIQIDLIDRGLKFFSMPQTPKYDDSDSL